MGRNRTIPQSASLTAPFTQGGLIIGITGGSGSGKTTLLHLVRERNGLVLDCDAIYHELLKTDEDWLRAIESRFPGTVADGELNRKKLGSIVFADEKALLDLNAITHQAVKEAVLLELAKKPSLAAIDAIGLFEGGLAELCDATVVVTAPEDVRISRLMARDNISEEYARARIHAQPKPEEFRKLCNFTLENNGTEADFREKCLVFFHTQGIINL